MITFEDTKFQQKFQCVNNSGSYFESEQAYFGTAVNFIENKNVLENPQKPKGGYSRDNQYQYLFGRQKLDSQQNFEFSFLKIPNILIFLNTCTAIKFTDNITLGFKD